MQDTQHVTSHDTRADSFEALGNAKRARLNERLYNSLAEAHRRGQPALSRRELRDFHNDCTGEWLEISSVASTVNALIAAKRLEEVEARTCSLPPHRLVKPVRCCMQQAGFAV
ncbi:hypothetical protein [Delftia sp. PS-11]|uniref:hypothetical protein n=1 Tax=Delftia sp. PS-11 TaxID=2767222 RepID=UPI002454E2FA|nr:hypothetical protein [Delftia sp. PS-11]KAJ8744592.1 hypothetical protein H9T68_11615 [Delftia sp. PS-11]